MSSGKKFLFHFAFFIALSLSATAQTDSHDQGLERLHKLDKSEGLGQDRILECSSEHEGEYNLPLHIAAVFIVIGVSLLGLSLPLIATRAFKKRMQKEGTIFKALKLFSAGVVLSTSLVHMIVPAFEALSDPCLPALLTTDYSAWAPVIVMFGIFFTHLIQVLVRQTLIKRLSGKALEPNTSDGSNPMIAKNERKSIVFLLEAGIAIHSVAIGIVLGFARHKFFVLLIAISFHQIFEGVALSTIILETNFKGLRPMIIAFVVYALSTSSGVAVGIVGQRVMKDYSTQIGIIVTGTLEAFGAGILLYDVLVNIISSHFNIKHMPASKREPETTMESPNGSERQEILISFSDDSPLEKFIQLCSLYFGAAAMSVIGKWA